jgi:hypothetical protein
MTKPTDWRKTCAELIEDVCYLIDCVDHDCCDPVALMECREHLSQFEQHALAAEQAAAARPTIEPVPVAERLPGPEDCDAMGRCWWFRPADFSDDVSVPSWHLDASPGPGQVRFYGYTHWLPHHAMPLPTQAP